MAEAIFEEMFDDTSPDKVEGNTMKSLSTVVKDLISLHKRLIKRKRS